MLSVDDLVIITKSFEELDARMLHRNIARKVKG